MIIKLNKKISESELEKIKAGILSKNENVRIVVNDSSSEKILGIIGENKSVCTSSVENNPNVIEICKISEPYKLSNRKIHPENTVIDLGDGCFLYLSISFISFLIPGILSCLSSFLSVCVLQPLQLHIDIGKRSKYLYLRIKEKVK